MNNMQSDRSSNDYDEIDLKEIFSCLFDGKWIIVSITTFTSIIGIIYSLSLPNIYESKALLAPVNSYNSIPAAIRQYGGLAGLAGANLSTESEDSNAGKAIAKLSSLSFFKEDFLPYINLPNLMALEKWDYKKNILIYDKSIYDQSSNLWVREYSYPLQQMPTPQESFYKFTKKHLSLSQDKDTGFITLSVKHQSPYIAKKWADLLVNQINLFYREKDKIESEKAIAYLNTKIITTNLSEVKQSISMLLQEEIQKLTLIEANNFYVFEYIDSPEVMERKSEPKRAIICIFSAILGGIIGIIIVLVRFFSFKKKIS